MTQRLLLILTTSLQVLNRSMKDGGEGKHLMVVLGYFPQTTWSWSLEKNCVISLVYATLSFSRLFVDWSTLLCCINFWQLFIDFLVKIYEVLRGEAVINTCNCNNLHPKLFRIFWSQEQKKITLNPQARKL